jgi:hypothetical protein
VDRAGACLSAALNCKQGKQSNSGEMWIAVNVFNKRSFVNEEKCFFSIGSVFIAWQQMKVTREDTTVSKTMNVGKMLFGHCDSFNKYAVLAKVCKYRYFT